MGAESAAKYAAHKRANYDDDGHGDAHLRQVTKKVAEKATNMRELMVMAGLRRRPYWVINWLFGLIIHVCVQYVFILAVAYGIGLGIWEFRSIVSHDFILVILFLILYACNVVSWACCWSTRPACSRLRCTRRHASPRRSPS